jgi:hypothetical protein
MSVASVSGYLSAVNPAVNPNFGLTVIEIPLIAPVATATSVSFTVINAYVVPKGTWLISGDVGLTTTIQANTIPEWITSVNRDGVLISSVRGGNNFWLGSALITTMPFVSDGTTTLTFAIVCSTSAGTWQTEPQGTGSGVYITKIAN